MLWVSSWANLEIDVREIMVFQIIMREPGEEQKAVQCSRYGIAQSSRTSKIIIKLDFYGLLSESRQYFRSRQRNYSRY
jgi:hypothetical protein